MRLHYSTMSQHARRVHMAAIELGLEVELKTVDFAKGEHKSPEYLSHNPNGKVPVLEDNGFWLWESNAIMQYLADKAPQKNLYPTDAKGRADVNRWLFWESAHWGAASDRLIGENVVKPMMMKQQPDPTIVAWAETNFARFAAVLNAQVEGKQWVTGNQITIADFSLASGLMYRQQAHMNTKPYPHLEAWFSRIEQRDSWQKTQPKF